MVTYPVYSLHLFPVYSARSSFPRMNLQNGVRVENFSRHILLMRICVRELLFTTWILDDGIPFTRKKRHSKEFYTCESLVWEERDIRKKMYYVIHIQRKSHCYKALRASEPIWPLIAKYKSFGILRQEGSGLSTESSRWGSLYTRQEPPRV